MSLLDQTELAQPVPLSTGADGVIRVKGTRVTLDTIVTAFREGATAEEIAQQYPSLALTDVYSLLGYYLREQAKVDDYLARREKESRAIRKENESMTGPFEVARSVPLARAIEDILLLAECSLEDEWEGQVRYLPL